MLDRITEERIARNESAFRDANEEIGRTADDLHLTERPVPFVCECADVSCHAIVRLPLSDYRRVRSNPRWFVNAPGHQVAALGASVVVEPHDGWSIVEKVGLAGEIAEELAPPEDER